MAKILIADDDLALSDVLAFSLRRAGYDIALAHDGRQAIERYRRELPDLIVLDWMMPYIDGLEVCTRIRAESNVPIVMLTVRNADDDVITALEAGADEYITKPFSPRQLIARIQAILRRTGSERIETLRAGSLSLNVERHEAYWDNRGTFHLTRLETRLLQALIQNTGNVLTNESLILRVWGPEGATNEMLKQLVYRLRNKLEPDPNSPSLIETVPNAGYSLRAPESSPGPHP
jgi:DNA-binding response OmpR family regulator